MAVNRTIKPTLPFPWKQGQMMSIIGQTGTGKSTLASHLLKARDWNLIFQTAPDPKTEYEVDVEAGNIKPLTTPNSRVRRILLRPSLPRLWWTQKATAMLLERMERARDLFYEALGVAFWQGGWCVYLDELLHIDRLGLRPPVETLLTEGRKRHITVVSGMQRPVAVSRFALGESRHLITFGLEGRDVKEFRDVTNDTAAAVAEDLDEYEFVWVCKPRGIWRGRLNLSADTLEGEYVR